MDFLEEDKEEAKDESTVTVEDLREDEDEEMTTTPCVDNSMDSNPNPVQTTKVLGKKKKIKVARKKNKRKSKILARCLFKQIDEGPILPLATQCAALLQEVEIPLAEFKVILDILQRIRKFLKDVYPNVVVTVFRHHYLQLRDVVSVSSSSKLLFVYMSDRNYKPLPDLPAEDLLKLFKGSSLKPLDEVNDAELTLKDEQSDYKIALFTSGNQKAEVITCELLNYLIQFDPRAKSLLSLLRYWAIENSVTLAEDGAPKWQSLTLFANQTVKIEVTPDPTALDWMLMFYLGKEKVIPMPLEVLRLQNKCYSDASFPFFEVRDNFIQEWRASREIPREGSRAYVLNVLELAHGFFKYFTSSNFRGVVLKTKDIVMDFIPGFKKPEKLYLTQPWASTRCFSVCQNKFENVAQPKMKKTLLKLEFYLKNPPGNKFAVEVDLKRLFLLEKLDVIYYAPMEVDLKKIIEGAEEELEMEKRNIMSIKCGCDGTSVCSDEFSLVHFFTRLCNEVLIPENEWAKVEEFQNRLTNIYPSCQLVIFRNGHLKLKTGRSDDDLIDIFFSLDYPGLYSEDETGTRHVLLPDEIPPELITAIKTLGNYSEDGTEENSRFFCHFVENPFKFHISSPAFLPDVQASRLVRYLTTFDPRVKPLMVVIFYWANVNNIQLGSGERDSSLLEWLVLSFLCGKIIPTPKKVCSRRSNGNVIFDGLEIGFKINPQHAREWRGRYNEANEEQNIINVLELAQHFFHYWATHFRYWKENPGVIDLKQCRWFFKYELKPLDLNDVEGFSKATGISTETLELIRSDPETGQRFFSYEEAVTILHPLHVKYGFSVSGDTFLHSICSQMGMTEDKLKVMLEACKGCEGVKRQKLCFDIKTVFLVNPESNLL